MSATEILNDVLSNEDETNGAVIALTLMYQLLRETAMSPPEPNERMSQEAINGGVRMANVLAVVVSRMIESLTKDGDN